MYWFLKVAEQNDASVEFGLSYIMNFHRDSQKYVYWFHLAAEHGYTLANFELGRDYEDIKKDYQQVAYWYQRRTSYQKCMQRKRSAKNPKLADYWYLRSEAITDLIHESARAGVQFKLGSIYETSNEIISQDIYQIFRWYSRAATKQHRMAQYRFGKIYMYG